MSREEEALLWDSFVCRRDQTARRRLIENYVDLSRIIAAQLYAKRPDRELEFGDYLHYALVGLMEAVDRYDPEREVTFSTYATYRIRGEILNGIEKANERLALESHKRRLRNERFESVTRPRDDERAFEEMADLVIELSIGFMLEDAGILHREEAAPQFDPYRSVVYENLQEKLCLIVNALPERDKTIISLHYFQHVRFDEIARQLGISKGRVSQLHSRALKLIRKTYTNLGSLDVLL